MKKFTASLILLLLFLALSVHPMKKRKEIINKNVKDDQKVILISQDKKEFEISRKVATISGYLKSKLEKHDKEEQDETPRIFVPAVHSSILGQLKEFMNLECFIKNKMCKNDLEFQNFFSKRIEQLNIKKDGGLLFDGAMKLGYQSIAKVLANQRSENRETLLYEACYNDEVDMVQSILSICSEEIIEIKDMEVTENPEIKKSLARLLLIPTIKSDDIKNIKDIGNIISKCGDISNITSKDGETLMKIACEKFNHICHIRNIATENYSTLSQNCELRKNVIIELVKSGAEIRKKDIMSIRPYSQRQNFLKVYLAKNYLSNADKQDNVDKIKRFIQIVPISIIDKCIKVIFNIASKRQDNEIIKYLLSIDITF